MKDVAASTPSWTGDIGFSHIQVKLPPCAPSSNVGVIRRYPERVKLRGDNELAEPRVADIASASCKNHKSWVVRKVKRYQRPELTKCYNQMGEGNDGLRLRPSIDGS